MNNESIVRWLAALAGLAILAATLVDGFEAMVTPRRVTRAFRPSRFFFRLLWPAWRWLAQRRSPKRRPGFLSIFGPLSMLLLFAIWVTCLIVGFALLHFGVGGLYSPNRAALSFANALYVSGETFFTLGYGDLSPLSWPGRIISVVESGIGFGFMAVIIGYLPVLYQAYSARETIINLLDARAGSPPTAGQCVLRAANQAGQRRLETDLQEWERWAAGLLDSHLSFPVLSYYRSQHDNQSWLAAVTCMLDTCALRMATAPQATGQQARLTFAMARHAVVDLSLVFRISPADCTRERFTIDSCHKLVDVLREQGTDEVNAEAVYAGFNELRAMYEPYVWSLAEYFLIDLPDVIAPSKSDNWQTSPWMKPTPRLNELISGGVEPVDEHFR